MTQNQKPDSRKSPWIDRRDVALLIGLALLAYGSWLVFPPAGFFVPGAIVASLAIFGVQN